MDELASSGHSTTWIGQKASVVKIFDEMRASSDDMQALYPKPFPALGESIICSRKIYGQFATFLASHYKIHTGEHKDKFLSCGVARNYLNILLNMGKEIFKSTAAGALFFMCLDKNSSNEHAVWLKGIKKTIERITFQRAKEAGEKQDKSESEPASPNRARALPPTLYSNRFHASLLNSQHRSMASTSTTSWPPTRGT